MRRLPYFILAFVAFLLSACEVRGVVEIEVNEDASGLMSVAVSLDDEAFARIDDLNEQLRTRDLIDAGWSVSPPIREEDGLTWVRATKPFLSADQLPIVAEETGVLSGVSILRDHTFAKTSYSFSATADLTDGLNEFGDDGLALELGGRPIGFDIAALEAELGPVADLADLTVIVRLPGDVNAEGAAIDGGEARWTVRLDEGRPIVLGAASEQNQTTPKLWLLAAGIAAVAAVMAFLYQGAQWIGGRSLRASGAGDARTASAPAGAPAEQAAAPVRRLELIVLDGMGVLFRIGDNVGRILIPFAREHGAAADDDTITEMYRLASLGRLSTREFWNSIGVEGDVDELDAAYVSRVELSPGAERFLRQAQEQGLRVACLTNSVARWVQLAQDKHQLEGLVDDWLISSAIGVRKPDVAAFEALRRASGVPFHNCLILDDRVEHLDAARKLGMSTALFDPDAEQASGDHRVVKSFATFFS